MNPDKRHFQYLAMMKPIDQARLDKELAAQKYRVEKLAIEAAAQKKKAEAIAHLESQGQRVEGVVGFQKKMAPKASDNTLNLLLGRKAVVIASEGEKVKEQLAKAALIKQQDESRRSRELKTANDNLPLLWESVFDEPSKSFYYWNRETNVTTWEKPETSAAETMETEKTEISAASLSMGNDVSGRDIEPEVAGWEEKVHPATQQKYYLNIHTGERRSTKPTAANTTARSSSSALPVTSSLGIKRPLNRSNDNSYADMQRNSIDPLDYEALQGCKRGGRGSDKMADSTASGPLWQQRPYPAPGTIMKSKEANSIATVGPSRGPNSVNDSEYNFASNVDRPVIAVRKPYVRGSSTGSRPTSRPGSNSNQSYYGPSK